MGLTSQCGYCARLRTKDGTPVCDAFPEGIPGEVKFDYHDHRLPYPGDHGIRFLAVSPEAEEYQYHMFVPRPNVRWSDEETDAYFRDKAIAARRAARAGIPLTPSDAGVDIEGNIIGDTPEYESAYQQYNRTFGRSE